MKYKKIGKRITLDYFYDDLLDYALVLGMTPEQYWYEIPRLIELRKRSIKDER